MSTVHNRSNAKPSTGEYRGEAPPSNAPNSAADPNQARPSPLDPLRADLAEMRVAAAHYAAAMRDLFVSRVRMAVIGLTVAVSLLCMMLAAGVTAVVFILQGIALALTEAFDGRLWAGELLTGAVVLVIFGVTVWIVVQGSNHSWHQRIMAKYEYFKQRELAARERSVRQAAERRQS